MPPTLVPPETGSGNERDGDEGAKQDEEPLADPPPQPSTDPWDTKTPRVIDSSPADNGGTDHIRRPPVSSNDSDVGSPTTSNGMQTGRRSPRRLDDGVAIMEAEAEARRRIANAEPSSLEVARPPPPETPGRNHSLTSEVSLAASPRIPEEDEFNMSANFKSATDRVSYGGSSRSRDSMQETFSPVGSGHRDSVQSIPENPDAITGGYYAPPSRPPIIPANFPVGVDDGLEAVPTEQPPESGLIPAETETFGHYDTAVNVQASPRPLRDCTLGLDSSFFLYKGFCEGAKEMTRGGNGRRKVKKPVSYWTQCGSLGAAANLWCHG